MTAERQRRAWVTSALIYGAVTLAYVWPLVGRMTTHLPSDLGDPALNTWILWWNAQVMPFTERWWNAPIFSPLSGAFALSETLLGATFLTTPLQWLGASPVFAYNVLYVLSFPAAALASHALALRLTGRHDAALIAGLAFGFHPYRTAQMPHVQMLLTCWMPLGLLALHQYMDTRRPRALVLFGVAWTMNALSNGYLMVFFGVLVGLWIVWFVRSWRDFVLIVGIAGLASLPLVPLVHTYREVQSGLGMIRSMGEIEGYSADLTSIWAASDHLLARYFTFAPKVEGELYPGIVVSILVIAAAWSVWPRGQRGGFGRLRLTAATVGAIAAAVAFGSWMSGGWQFGLAGLEVSMTRPYKIVTVAVTAFVVALFVDHRLIDGWRRRSVLLFFVAASGVLFSLALGPVSRAFDERFFFRAPYWWLMELPGGNSLRVPARFAMPMILCLVQAAAIGFVRLTPRGASLFLSGALAALVALDGFPMPLPAVAVPAVLQLPGVNPAARVLELPTLDLYDDTAAMVRSIGHRHVLINGYSGYEPPHYFILRNLLKDFDMEAIDALRATGPLLVVLDAERDPDNVWRLRLERFPGARRVREAAGRVVYEVDARPAPQALPSSDLLRIAGVSASQYPEKAPWMADGDMSTRWEDPADDEHGRVVIALDAPAEIARVELRLGEWSSDFPRKLLIEVATGQGAPRTVWRGAASGLSLLASIQDWRTMPLEFDLPPGASGDRVILTLIEGHETLSWSIAEVRVFGRR